MSIVRELVKIATESFFQYRQAKEALDDIEKNRRSKKIKSLRMIADNIQSLRNHVTRDMKSDDEKTQLTALVVALMDKTAERVGNETSKDNGHFGVTGFKKKHITLDGNKITFKYIGKSAVEQEKTLSDETIAKLLKKCLDRCKNNECDIFVTSDGFKIKADRVNRYLEQYEITAKDIRGYAANRLIIEALNASKDGLDEVGRKKRFNEILSRVAEKVGHQKATLRIHYMLPNLESQYVKEGKIMNIREASVVDSIVASEIFNRVAKTGFEELIFSAVKDVMGSEKQAWIVAPWIYQGLYDSQGKFIVTDINNIKFDVKWTDPKERVTAKGMNKPLFTATFSADLRVVLADDPSDKVIKKKYSWKFDGKNYRGKIS